ncbi:NPCBM/NEW2 domain protein [Rubripirellula amarantea]|uniref:NPCBM/NEW2 domain protein n=1 Tax=Rubripirellula amarantea TaxID=2527999 RepID=A0A5C5WWR8_9BACT|nr:NPCBM/NEW2 domain protein [Rubripirellula amarantea]
MEVSTTSGETYQGSLSAIATDGLVLDQDGAKQTISLEELTGLSVVDAPPRTGPKSQITFVGGSRIFARDIRIAGETAEIELPRQPLLRVPVQSIRAIRFAGPAAETDAAWLGILEKETRGDTMVIRRPGNRLDPTIGIVEGIAGDKVNFNLDGDSVAAPIDRLEGIIFGATSSSKSSKPVTITDVYGSTWLVDEVVAEPSSPSLEIRFDNAIHRLPLELLSSIRWSSGLMMLASVEPAETSLKPSLAVNIDPALVESLLGPQSVGLEDLILRGGCSTEYRIEDGFRTFSGSVRRDERVKSASEVSVRILLDGELVWKESLPDAQARGFELDINNARRVTLQVDSGNDGDMGTTIRFNRPRLLK